ncbi:GNAT family N-acetyltransferase [Microbacterium sp. NPDC057650]|uniref:GNAT family N-acetyltransferase n=1 Tax=unclassified Microbacterium TaxID=2609290 RepID=UPI0036714BE1
MTRDELEWPIEAGPLTLRPPREEDVDRILGWRNRPEVTRWLIRTVVDREEFRRMWLESVADPDDHRLVALLGDRIVGVGELWRHDSMGQSHVEDGPWQKAEAGIGYLIDPAHAGRGYATAIGSALLELAFDGLGVHRVTAGCFADNHASVRVLEKIGMRREQHGVGDSWHADLGWIDGYTYALLASEWRALSRR